MTTVLEKQPAHLEEQSTHVPPLPKEGDASDLQIDPEAERRLVWKLDRYIYPPLYILYMMAFLDRINISNARIQGMVTDLDLTGNRFNVALFVCETSL